MRGPGLVLARDDSTRSSAIDPASNDGLSARRTFCRRAHLKQGATFEQGA